MTLERWKKIKELFDAALERSTEKRSDFLAEACSGDDLLLGEVQRLLAEHHQAGEFLNSPPWGRLTESTGTAASDGQAGDEGNCQTGLDCRFAKGCRRLCESL